MKTNKSMHDILICIGVLIFLGGFIAQIAAVPANARGYPLFLLCISALLTITLLLYSVRAYKSGTSGDKNVWTVDRRELIVQAVLYGIITALYIFFMGKIGYIIATIVFITASLLFLRVHNKKLLILLPLCLTFSMYFLFTIFLSVTLPRGTWFSLIF